MIKPRIRLDKHGLRMIIREYISRILMLVFLLLAAGDLRWQRAWTFFLFMVVMNFLFHLFVVIPNPDLYNERGNPKENVKPWDRKCVLIYGLIGYFSMIFIGLDKRFGWSYLNENWIIPGAVLITLSFSLSAWCMRVNRYFSSVVRIQNDRGQRVCDRGPYSVIRHPGYFSAFLFYFGSPMMLGSVIAFMFAFLVIAVFSYRIIREEEALTEELPGYKEYKEKIKYRLLPGLW